MNKLMKILLESGIWISSSFLGASLSPYFSNSGKIILPVWILGLILLAIFILLRWKWD